MRRATVDANVFASGVLGYRRPESPPGDILRRWLAGSFELVISQPLIVEIERTLLTKPYFTNRISRAAGARWIAALTTLATRTELTTTVSGVATHPEDDLVLATAVSAAADYLVTGDKPLQRLVAFQGVNIVGPRDFLTILQQDELIPS